jgi:hypothetical protein
MRLAQLPRWLLEGWRRLRSRPTETRVIGRLDDHSDTRRGADDNTQPASVRVISSIEDARRKFADSLVGRWSQGVGTFGSVIDQYWEIRSDGTGLITDTGPFGYARSVRQFEWRQDEERVFQLRIVKLVEMDGAARALDEHEEPWRAVRYDFIEVVTDACSEVGLVEVSDGGSRREGFAESYAPLSYRGTTR